MLGQLQTLAVSQLVGMRIDQSINESTDGSDGRWAIYNFLTPHQRDGTAPFSHDPNYVIGSRLRAQRMFVSTTDPFLNSNCWQQPRHDGGLLLCHECSYDISHLLHRAPSTTSLALPLLLLLRQQRDSWI